MPRTSLVQTYPRTSLSHVLGILWEVCIHGLLPVRSICAVITLRHSASARHDPEQADDQPARLLTQHAQAGRSARRCCRHKIGGHTYLLHAHAQIYIQSIGDCIQCVAGTICCLLVSGPILTIIGIAFIASAFNDGRSQRGAHSVHSSHTLFHVPMRRQ